MAKEHLKAFQKRQAMNGALNKVDQKGKTLPKTGEVHTPAKAGWGSSFIKFIWINNIIWNT